MTLYDTIFTRRSVRQYDPSPLEPAVPGEIERLLNAAAQLPGQSARFEIVGADALKGVSAPHAILAYAPDEDAALANIGYTLQGIDLYLQSLGYGSIWLGMGGPIEAKENYRVLLAFGKTSVPPRSGEGDFKRNPVLEISNADNAVARAARLAPSAVNFQPWRLVFSPGKVSVQYHGRGIGKLLAGKFQKIDLGICLKHVVLALEHEGKTISEVTPVGEGKGFAVEVSYAD